MCGILVVVARQRVEAAHARQEFARAVAHVRIGIKVAGRERCAAQVIASPLNRGCRVVVVGLWVQATRAARVIANARNRGRLVVVARVGVQAALAREVLARAVVDVGVWVEVARPVQSAAQHEARHELTRAVVLAHVLVVVARQRIQTPNSLVLVAHAIAVHVEQQHRAVRRTLLAGVVCKDTRPVVLGGRRVVVACRVAGAALARIVVARSTVGGRRVVVARDRVLTSHHFVRIAHPVSVLVAHNHHPCAVELSRTRFTWVVSKQTLCWIGGLGVEVARCGDLTSSHFQLVAHPIAVGIVDARAVALVQLLRIRALKAQRRWVGGLGVVIACQNVLTARNFQFVAHPVAVGVVHTVAVAVVRRLGIDAGAVVEVDFRVEVARTRVVAPKRQT